MAVATGEKEVARESALTGVGKRSSRFNFEASGMLLQSILAVCLIALFVAFALFPGIITSYDPLELNTSQAFLSPSWSHLFGTDVAGRDLFSRVVHGTRYSLGMAIVIVISGSIFGVIFGAISGYFGGALDELMMRIVDIFLAFPTFVLAMAIAATVGRGMTSLVIALAIIWWPSYARMIRGMVLSIKESQHIEAARAIGMTDSRILQRHIIPLTFREINVRVTTEIGYALVAVTSLSFIGLGAQQPTPEWGLILADARRYITGAWWYPIFPGAAITLVTFAFSLLGDSLAELTGPDSRRR